MAYKILDDNIDWISEYIDSYEKNRSKLIFEALDEEISAVLRIIEISEFHLEYLNSHSIRLIHNCAFASLNFSITHFPSNSSVRSILIENCDHLRELMQSVCEILLPEKFAYCWPGCPCQQESYFL